MRRSAGDPGNPGEPRRPASDGAESPYRVLARAMDRIGPDASPEAALTALLRNLVGGTGASHATVRSTVDGRVAELAGWPRPPAGDGRVRTVPVPAGDGEPATLELAKPGALTARDEALLAQTAQCAGVLIHAARLDGELARRTARTRELDEQLAASRQQLQAVQALERRRVVTEILTLSAPLLAEIRRAVDDCATAPDAGPAGPAPGQLSALLDELIGRFRTVVRGVHSAVLGEEGPLAALDELAADLPRPVLLSGALPERVSPEVAAVLYHSAASILRALTGTSPTGTSPTGTSPGGPATGPIDVRFGWQEATGRATVELRGRPGSPARLWAALAAETAALAALGGALDRSVGPGSITVRLALPDRLQPSPEPPPGPEPAGSLLDQTRTLLAAAVEVYAGQPGSADLAAAAAALAPAGASAGQVRTALAALDATLRSHPLPPPALDPLTRAHERIAAGAHELAELEALAAFRSGETRLAAELTAAAERLLGASGLTAHARLGLDPAAGPAAIGRAAAAELDRWRRLAAHPAIGRAARLACGTVIRTCEGLLTGGIG